MHQIHLSDQLYQQAQRRATEAGFPSVDEYIADVVQHDLMSDAPGEIASDEQLAAEWTQELDRRIVAVRAGNEKGIDPDAMLANVRHQLAANRNARNT